MTLGTSMQMTLGDSTIALNSKSCEIEVISTPTALFAIEQDWRRLESENIGRTTVFQSFDWAQAWCETYLTDKDGPNLCVITGRSSGRIVFILPLSKTRRHGLNILDWLTDPIGQYGDVLCANNQDPQIWLKAAFDELKKSQHFDLVRLRHVRATGNVAAFAKENLFDAKYNERAPFLDLTAFKSEAEYDARYTSTQRKRRKKIRKSLEDLGQVTFNVVEKGPALDNLIDTSIAEKNAWLSDRGRFNRIMGCSKHLNFLKRLSRTESTALSILATELSADAKPVSWEIAFRYNGTHFAYITSHVNALTDLSPGRLHMDLSQRQALADGQETFDLMVPYDLHKDSWSSGTIPTNDYFMPISLLGRLYGTIFLQTLRPILRKIYYNMSPRLLRLLQPITRH